jgi:5S rRNA maturation endonuclease (ribonuclease M5)
LASRCALSIPRIPNLAARGISLATAEQFGIGFYRGVGIFRGRLVIPIHNERWELVAYCGRTLDGTRPRYRSPAGFPKAEILFNLHRAAPAGQQNVVVVEGFFDCLKLHQAGVPAAVALTGAALADSQQRALLEHFRNVILMLDGDTAGRCASGTVARRLRAHASVRVIHLPDQVQPDQLSSEATREVLQAHSGVPDPICYGEHWCTHAARSAVDGTREHGKENPPTFCAVRCSHPTRALSPRQLPTDHECGFEPRILV